MNDIAIKGAFKPELHSIEDCLAELERYGKPSLSKLDGGWHSRMNVFVTGEGSEFKVKSEYDHSTPTEAINCCYERLISAISKIKEVSQ